MFRHSTLLAGAFSDKIYEFIPGVYDTDGYLKQRWWRVPLNEETEKAEKSRAEVIAKLGTSQSNSSV